MRISSMVLIGSMIVDANLVYGQNFPNKPIRIVTASAGGGADITSRLIAQGIAGPLGQPAVIDNRPNGIASFEIVQKAPPDGYTLLVYNNSVWLLPLMQKAPYDPVKDFLPVAMMVVQPNILVIYPGLLVKSVQELITLAKSKPGELNYASTGLGSGSQLAGELFKAMAHVNIVNIPYKGTGPAFSDLLPGRVHMMIPTAGAAAPHVNSGKLTALGVTSAQPSVLFPDLPTVAASGLPGYETVSMTGMFAPAKTPAAIIERLNQETVRFVRTPAAKEKFFNVGFETVGSSPREFAAYIRSDMREMGKVIKDAGIKMD